MQEQLEQQWERSSQKKRKTLPNSKIKAEDDMSGSWSSSYGTLLQGTSCLCRFMNNRLQHNEAENNTQTTDDSGAGWQERNQTQWSQKWLISNYIWQTSRIFMTGSNLGEVNQLLQMVASLWDVENTDPKAKRAMSHDCGKPCRTHTLVWNRDAWHQHEGDLNHCHFHWCLQRNMTPEVRP